ncbi:MAG TPA: DUF4870 domain-containing protein [Candidatus Tumulicola sp.]|jgi:hypothetical protein
MISDTTQQRSEERNWAMAAHLSALVAVMGIPFGHVVGPLIVYLLQRDRSPFVAAHARASLNFQITISIVAVVLFGAVIAAWFFVVLTTSENERSVPARAVAIWLACLFVMLLGAIGTIVWVVMGALAASRDLPYRYPFAITFVR